MSRCSAHTHTMIPPCSRYPPECERNSKKSHSRNDPAHTNLGRDRAHLRVRSSPAHFEHMRMITEGLGGAELTSGVGAWVKPGNHVVRTRSERGPLTGQLHGQCQQRPLVSGTAARSVLHRPGGVMGWPAGKDFQARSRPAGDHDQQVLAHRDAGDGLENRPRSGVYGW